LTYPAGLNNIFKEHELPEKSNVHFLHIAFTDEFHGWFLFNLDVFSKTDR